MILTFVLLSSSERGILLICRRGALWLGSCLVGVLSLLWLVWGGVGACGWSVGVCGDRCGLWWILVGCGSGNRGPAGGYGEKLIN